MNLPRIISRLLAILLFIIMPFVFSPILQDVEQTPRFLFLALIIAGVVFFLGTSVFINRSKSPLPIGFDNFYIVLILWISVNALSLTQSINFNDAIIELLKIILFVALFFIFIIVLGVNENFRALLYRAISVGVLVFIGIGIYQFWNEYTVIKNKDISVIISYTASSLGNKNFFAETLLLMLPFVFISFINQSKLWKLISGFALLGIIIELMILQTLSTWVSMVIGGTIVLLNLYFCRRILFQNPEQRKKWVTISGVVLVTAIFSAGMFLFITDNEQILKRLSDIKSIVSKTNTETDNQNSIQERMVMWDNAIRVFADNPVKGVGLANLKIIAPTYGLGNARHMSTGNIVYTHPHNEFLLAVCESGLLGLLIYTAVFIVLLIYLWKLITHADARSELVNYTALLFVVICFIVIAMVSLPSTRFYPMILLMLTAALIVAERKRKALTVKRVGYKPVLLTCVLFLSVAVISISISKNRIKDDFTLSKALIAERKGNYPLMRKLLLTIDREMYPIDVNVTPVAWYLGFSEFYLQDRAKAFEHFMEAEQVNPNHLMVLNDLGTSYNLSGNAEMAITYYKKALGIQPEFSDALINLSIIYYNQGKIDEAYNTIIKHKTKIEKDRIIVFKTILSAKAATITGTEIMTPEFENYFKSGESVNDLLITIREKNGKIDELL